MTAQDLDQTYAALCNALASVGETQAQPFLAMLSLSLIAHSPSAGQVLHLIEQAQTRCEGFEIAKNSCQAINTPLAGLHIA